MFKKKTRFKKTKYLRSQINKTKNIRLIIFKSLNNVYIQIIYNNNTLISISTLNKTINKISNYSKNKYIASILGNIITKFCIRKGIKKVIFDRSGYKYHGKIKALAESIQESGLIFKGFKYVY